MPPTEKILKVRLIRKGPIPFRDFMEIALGRLEGCYTRRADWVGEKDDYYTAGSLRSHKDGFPYLDFSGRGGCFFQ